MSAGEKMPQRRHRAINLLPSSGLNHHFLAPDFIHPVSSDSGTSTSHGSRSIQSKQGESVLSSKGGGINFRRGGFKNGGEQARGQNGLSWGSGEASKDKIP